jgi:predicted amidohydrolase YtcJ
MKSITMWSAIQHFEEATKGSIEVGKLADSVILDRVEGTHRERATGSPAAPEWRRAGPAG